MKITENVRSREYPIKVDTTNDKFVYERINIKAESEIDPVFHTQSPVYVYDEIEYTWSEWYELNIKKINEKLDSTINILLSLANKVGKDYDIVDVVSSITDLYSEE